MTSASAPDPDEPQPLGTVVLRREWKLGRFVAGIAGVALLTLVSIFTLGLALIAPLGMVAARMIARREKTSLTFGTSWLGAAISVAFALTAVAIVGVLLMPGGTFSKIQHAADSASVAQKKQPPPAWLDRISPGASVRARATPNMPTFNRAMTIWVFVVGGVFTCTVFAVLIGTAGWAPSLLLSYAFTGRWIPGS